MLVASRENGIEEVRLKTPDGVTLHGWLKHPPAPSGGRFPLVIVFGGVRRETSWMIDQGDKPERWDGCSSTIGATVFPVASLPRASS